MMSDCRILKRATYSLRLRLARGRPPAVGIDSSFFNLTPPSAEAITPEIETNNVQKTIVTESVENTILIEAKEKEETVTNGEINERFVRAQPPDFNPEPHS